MINLYFWIRNQDRLHMNQLATSSLQDRPSSNNLFQIRLRAKFERSLEQERMQFWLKQLRSSKKCMWNVHQTWLITMFQLLRIACCHLEQMPGASCAQLGTRSESWTRTKRGPWVGRKAVLDPSLEADFTHLPKWRGTTEEGTITCMQARVGRLLQLFPSRDHPHLASIIKAVRAAQLRAWSKSLRPAPRAYRTWAASIPPQTTLLDREAFSREPCLASRRRLWLRCKRRLKKRKAIDYSTSKVRCRCSKSQLTRLTSPSRKSYSRPRTSKGTSKRTNLEAVASLMAKND